LHDIANREAQHGGPVAVFILFTQLVALGNKLVTVSVWFLPGHKDGALSFSSSSLLHSQTTYTMVKPISYNTISQVLETWEQLRRMKNYEEVAGVKLFQR